MAVNEFFNHYTDYQEQSLVEDLIIECIQFYGMDMVYLPTKARKLDLIYGEDPVEKFHKSYCIEMYIQSTDGFTGDRDFLSKFGLEMREQATLTVSQKRFHEEVTEDGMERIRPNEGDLIFFPLNGSLFEIKFVEPRSVFYQLGELYVYNLKIDKYEYSHEEFTTRIPEIDAVQDKYANTIALELSVGTGTYQDGEWVFQGPSLAAATAKAKVAHADTGTNTLYITQHTGKFVTTQNVFGATSSASWFLDSIDETKALNDPIDNSEDIEDESEQVIDFDENNPFGDT